MARHTLHLTLAFLGHIRSDRIEAAREVAEGIRQEAFDWSVDRLNYWPHNHILWAGSSQVPAALTALAAKLHAGLGAAGLKFEPRAFTPHITLLRNCPGYEADAEAGDEKNPLPQALAWKARDFVLLESRPEAGAAHYEPIGRWPLLA